MGLSILGIDVGSVSVSLALVSEKNGAPQVGYHTCEFHNGDPLGTLKSLLALPRFQGFSHIAVTDSTPSGVTAQHRVHDQVAMMRTARHFHGQDFCALLTVGAEKFSVSVFDETGSYTGARHNTSCAAGTGGFLDQQARRLNLDTAAKISEFALSNEKERPDIATRCAVFAKTDLIHAQQEGYDVAQICDGLCFGLAQNIANTLFKGQIAPGKILFCGGVAKNQAVIRHLEQITGRRFFVDDACQVYGAAGAALCLWDECQHRSIAPFVLDSDRVAELDTVICGTNDREKASHYPELTLRLSDYPDFTSFCSYESLSVEVDIYHDPCRTKITKGFLGLDVGSTSTKAVVIDQDGIPLAGFYTRTASRPVQAVQKIFQVCDQMLQEYGLDFPVAGCGTTGSGRRISGKIIGADMEPDEITAHATAAVNLNKDVDTIIEIGGQDAKFTLLSDGMVTSSVMNTVCAAGTGSFIEEQALKLACPLSEYSARAEGVKAPVASDRCTVFMERDINYYMAQGYSTNEILASVLHSVRDNYLTKVANTAQIGNHILFQGATAKNRALVAAFEQKLNKPIHVSRFCHLTGALGTALLVQQEGKSSTRFRGFDLWKEEILVRQEVCKLCTNHCKLTIAQLADGPQAYGFLCGRDYDTQKRVAVKKKFDLKKTRKSLVQVPEKVPVRHDVTIGLPAALHMVEDLDFWRFFFGRLGFSVITSEHLKHPVQLGKHIAAAEFCAPMLSLHGHVAHLMDKADVVFLPRYFEEKTNEKNARRQHCYYTQFAPAAISCLEAVDEKRLLSPTVKYLYSSFHTKVQLYKTLNRIAGNQGVSFLDIHNAWDSAWEYKRKNARKMSAFYENHVGQSSDFSVLLLGRPYTVLSDSMNKNIPGIFENIGVQVLFQDMVDTDSLDVSKIASMLEEIHWKHAARILKTAYFAAISPNLYPVFLTSFKCSPDAFALDYFKKIMESVNKPYLVLELDEHDSNVGYETRIEAAVRAFSNHYRKCDQSPGLVTAAAKAVPLLSCVPSEPLFDTGRVDSLSGKTVIFPNWDTYTGRLMVASFLHEGINAVLMEETPETLKKCMLTNTGQCIPLNAIAQGFIHTVETRNIAPENAVLWLNQSEIACNIKMYPFHIRRILQSHGKGFENAGIYLGELSLFDLSFKASINAYFAYMVGGLLRSMGCKIRPYEVVKGKTDLMLEKALEIIAKAFVQGTSKEDAIRNAVEMLSRIETRKDEPRPKVAIFGDLYVRDNDVMNQDLIHYIEANGGEVVITPYYKYIKLIANSYFKKWFNEGKYLSLISHRALFIAMQTVEKRYYPYFEPLLEEKDMVIAHRYEKILEQYGIVPEHTGESMDNILKIHYIIDEHPDLALLVQTNPAFCCAGLITESMASALEKTTGVPIVSITYDISGGNKNKVIVPFLQQAGKQAHQSKILTALV